MFQDENEYCEKNRSDDHNCHQDTAEIVYGTKDSRSSENDDFEYNDYQSSEKQELIENTSPEENQDSLYQSQHEQNIDSYQYTMSKDARNQVYNDTESPENQEETFSKNSNQKYNEDMFNSNDGYIGQINIQNNLESKILSSVEQEEYDMKYANHEFENNPESLQHKNSHQVDGNMVVFMSDIKEYLHQDGLSDDVKIDTEEKDNLDSYDEITEAQINAESFQLSPQNQSSNISARRSINDHNLARSGQYGFEKSGKQFSSYYL